jgi:hypothetical protein
MKNRCIDCGKELSRKNYKRCAKCFGKKHSKRMKGKNNPAWKDGKTLKQYTCKKCRKKINKNTYLYGSKLCMSCAIKNSYKLNKLNTSGKNNPMYGKEGKKHPRWNGGRVVGKYVLIYKPNHPHKNNKNYVLEHRLVMEKHLGRYLKPKEVVHHINEIRTDNRIENLMLFKNDSEHKHFHKLEREKRRSDEYIL